MQLLSDKIYALRIEVAIIIRLMKEMIAAQQCFVATVNPDGTPNIGPKRTTRVLDDEHLAYNEVTGKQNWGNVGSGSKVAIAVADRENMKGFRFVGTPEVVTSGAIYNEAVAMIRQSRDELVRLGIPLSEILTNF
jgi:predicted pyridoxine 5'-phosphate oxidase superfamily flavin-nucleotide-binding protein